MRSGVRMGERASERAAAAGGGRGGAGEAGAAGARRVGRQRRVPAARQRQRHPGVRGQAPRQRPDSVAGCQPQHTRALAITHTVAQTFAHKPATRVVTHSISPSRGLDGAKGPRQPAAADLKARPSAASAPRPSFPSRLLRQDDSHPRARQLGADALVSVSRFMLGAQVDVGYSPLSDREDQIIRVWTILSDHKEVMLRYPSSSLPPALFRSSILSLRPSSPSILSLHHARGRRPRRTKRRAPLPQPARAAGRRTRRSSESSSRCRSAWCWTCWRAGMWRCSTTSLCRRRAWSTHGAAAWSWAAAAPARLRAASSDCSPPRAARRSRARSRCGRCCLAAAEAAPAFARRARLAIIVGFVSRLFTPPRCGPTTLVNNPGKFCSVAAE